MKSLEGPGKSVSFWMRKTMFDFDTVSFVSVFFFVNDLRRQQGRQTAVNGITSKATNLSCTPSGDYRTLLKKIFTVYSFTCQKRANRYKYLRKRHFD